MPRYIHPHSLVRWEWLYHATIYPPPLSSSMGVIISCHDISTLTMRVIISCPTPTRHPHPHPPLSRNNRNAIIKCTWSSLIYNGSQAYSILTDGRVPLVSLHRIWNSCAWYAHSVLILLLFVTTWRIGILGIGNVSKHTMQKIDVVSKLKPFKTNYFRNG